MRYLFQSKFQLITLLFSFGTLLFAILINWTYAQTSTTNTLSPTLRSNMTSSTVSTPIPSNIAHGVKIISPTKGQNVSTGTIAVSGTSNDNTTSDCHVSVIVNGIKPYQNASATGPGGENDYSKWNLTLSSKYTVIKEGLNKLTAKFYCNPNPSIASFYSINVTGTTTGILSKPVASSATIQSAPVSMDSNITNVFGKKPTELVNQSSDPICCTKVSSTTSTLGPVNNTPLVDNTHQTTQPSTSGNIAESATQQPQSKTKKISTTTVQKLDSNSKDNKLQDNGDGTNKVISNAGNYNYDNKPLSISMFIAKNPVSSGSTQTITVTVFSKNSNDKIARANIEGSINYDNGKTKKFVGITDGSGEFSYSWKIDKNSDLGVVNINVQASKFGYYSVVKVEQFVIIADQNNNDVSVSHSTKNVDELSHSRILTLPVSHKDHSVNSNHNTNPTQDNNDKNINNFNQDSIFGSNNIKKSVHGITHKDHSVNSNHNTNPTQDNNDKNINNFNQDSIFGSNNIKKSVHGITHKDHSVNSNHNTNPTQDNNDKNINNFNQDSIFGSNNIKKSVHGITHKDHSVNSNHNTNPTQDNNDKNINNFNQDSIFGSNNIKKSVHGITQNILNNIQHNLNNQGIHISIPFN